MFEFLGRLFDTSDFPARWSCGNWTSGHGWLHVVSDCSVFLAYLTIPCVLIYFMRKRQDLPFSGIFWLFVAFIFTCGTTHLVEATIFWHPWYRLSGVLKLITAVVSLATVVALIPAVPKALALPGLAVTNARLEHQAKEQRAVEKRLRAKTDELEQLLYVVSHDLKSPLVTISGFVGILARHIAAQDTEKQQDAIARIQRGATTMERLIDDLLEVSRISSRELELESVSVDEVAREVVESLEAPLSAAGATVVIGSPLPRVRADRSQLLRALLNLVHNAIKYGCPEPGATIHITAERSGHETRIRVADAGPGIDRQHHVRVFQLFQRLSTDREGTGLGLATVAKIMERHGGRAGIDSVPGSGSSFWLAFPDSGTEP